MQRKTIWTDDAKDKSRLFSTFDEHLIEEMERDEIVLHLHDLGVLRSDYESTPMKDFFIVSSVDYLNDQEYLTGMEAVNYPIFAVMYHPEY